MPKSEAVIQSSDPAELQRPTTDQVVDLTLDQPVSPPYSASNLFVRFQPGGVEDAIADHNSPPGFIKVVSLGKKNTCVRIRARVGDSNNTDAGMRSALLLADDFSTTVAASDGGVLNIK
jgi:hypothetical protein